MNNDTLRFGERRGLSPPSGPPGQARRLAWACRPIRYQKPPFPHLVLVAEANEHSGTNNITVIVARFEAAKGIQPAS